MKTSIKLIAIIVGITMLITGTSCNLTRVKVTSRTSTTISYIEDEKDTSKTSLAEENLESGILSETEAESDSEIETNSKHSDSKVVSNTKNSTAESKSTGTSSTPPKEADESKITGKFELQIFTGGYGSECWEYAINEFQKLQPELDIIAHLDTNVNAQMRTRWSKNNPPDFVFLEGTNVPKETWMIEGKLRDMSSLYNTGKVYGTNKIIKNQLKDGLVNKFPGTNKIYEMPVLLSTYGMWYDQTLFKNKGWTVPKNYTELKSFSSKAKSANINPIIYTGQYSGYLVWGLIMPAIAAEAVASNDLQYFYDVANASNEAVFSDKRFRKVLNKLDELAQAGYFDLNGLSMNHITSQASWLQRGSALIPNGLWLENEMKDSTPNDFKMKYYPAMLQDANQKKVIIASSSTVGVATEAKNPKAAEAFIRFLYTDDIARKFAELCAVPSATKTDVTGAKLTEAAKQVNELINSSEVTLISKGSTTWGIVDATINNCVNQIVARKYTVQKAIDELVNATRKKNN